MINYKDILYRVSDNEGIRLLIEAMFVEHKRILTPMLECLDENCLPNFISELEDIWHVLCEMEPQASEAKVQELMKGLEYHSIEFLRRQAMFAKSGTYQTTNFETICDEIYFSKDIMQSYLYGLLLTYVAWPNHYRLLRFYKERYLTQGPFGSCMEIGTGHGWLALQQLRFSSRNNLIGFDISPHAVVFTSELLKAAGIKSDRYKIRIADIQNETGNKFGCLDRIVIAEVLEHVEKPTAILDFAKRYSHNDTIFFISTCINIEAVDHLYLYKNLEEVREMLNKKELRIIEELVLPLLFGGTQKTSSYEVGFICKNKI